ncbi:MAG: hypothetical protein RLZZ129_1685 [Verrucomicrobiota bacterium]|jgi:hypothetical protein
MSAINEFLLRHNLRIASNPCVSPDFCLDWPVLQADVRAGQVTEYPKSRFATAAGEFTLWENAAGDCAWKLHAAGSPLAAGVAISGATFFPATFANLLTLKNLIQEHDAGSTIFPTAGAKLGKSTLGVGARFTTLHWPAVEWAMSALEIGLTANQNSIPRELVYDVDAMLANRLDTVPFPFIGTNVPEGHQGQSVEGMSHGCVLSKLKTGFHRRRIAWSFNADHQPIGGKFDVREDALVKGCLLASYITFDLSPELALNQPAKRSEIPDAVVHALEARLSAVALAKVDDCLLCSVWPALQKMKRRDEKYAAARAAAFTTEVGRTYLRELSIDELPGLTTPETTAIMLALCEVLGMPANFVAPAFGFQKNTPYPDNAALKQLIEAQWNVCKQFGVSIGFHSGSGKSAENYQVMGSVTGSALEIKTSGRYTYEMGVALSQSKNAADAALWKDWYQFTVDMAVAGAFSADATEQKMARVFVTTTLAACGSELARDGFASPAACRAALEALPPSAEHMTFFEYNFLYMLAAGGKPEKAALGDHSPAGYQQRARFYAISPEARLRFAKRIAAYLIWVAENTGLASKERCAGASKLLATYTTLDAMLGDISR